MFIAKVIGNVVSTQKNEKFLGMKLLLVQPYISKEGKLHTSGSSIVAARSQPTRGLLALHATWRSHKGFAVWSGRW